MFARDSTFIYNQFKMTEQTDYNSIPLNELEKMVAGMPLSQMDTENPEEPKGETEQSNGEAPAGESKETGEEPKGEPEQEEKSEEQQPEKKTPESIKKLLHQRSELRQDNDRLNAELAEAKELIRKLRS
jgi:hypothetical protein